MRLDPPGAQRPGLNFFHVRADFLSFVFSLPGTYLVSVGHVCVPAKGSQTPWRKTMFEKAKSGRDAFTFSLHGLTTIASFTLAPAIAEDRIDRAVADRSSASFGRGSRAIRRIEDFLGRYFAPRCGQAQQA